MSEACLPHRGGVDVGEAGEFEKPAGIGEPMELVMPDEPGPTEAVIVRHPHS